LNILSQAISIASLGLYTSCAVGAEISEPLGFEIEEIIVTAQRRVESLQEVPISVSVVDSDFIDGARIRQVTDVIDYTPGLSGGSTGLIEPKYAIRGISSSQDIGVGGAESVGVFMNGSYLGTELASLAFLDAAQIEVLKGPQGSLFGCNT